MTEEHAVQGWDAFCRLTQMSMSKAMSYKDDLKIAGAIFYLRKGHPPAPRMYFFPSVVKRWLGEMTRDGKIL